VGEVFEHKQVTKLINLEIFHRNIPKQMY